MRIDWFPASLKSLHKLYLSNRRRQRHSRLTRQPANCSAEIQSLEARQLLAVDLTPYQPAGWSDKIVVSKQQSTHTDASAFTIGDYNYYIDTAILNSGITASDPYKSTLKFDGSTFLSIQSGSGTPGGSFSSISDYLYKPGFLSAGNHTFTLTVDSDSQISESDETNNSYTRSINVAIPASATPLSIPTADILTATSANWLNTPGTITAAVSNVYTFTLANASGLFLDLDSRDITSPLSGTLDAAMALYDSAGNIVATNDNGYDFRGFSAPATAKTSATSIGLFDPDIYADVPAGTYYLAIAGGAASAGDYLLHALADTNYSAFVPALNSNPTAADTFYLDFNGHSATDAWGTYTAAPYSLDANASTFSPGERLAIQNLWRATSEDFSPFNVNISTVDPGSFANGQALRMVITNTSPSIVGQGSGTLGYAFLSSFASGTNDNTAFTFASEFDSFNGFGAGLNGKIMATALDQAGTVSHELGHTLGLKHYNSKTGNFAGNADIISNALMATPNSGVLRQTWAAGNADNTSPNVIAQDDVAVISNGANTFGYRADDYGDSPATATTLSHTGGFYSAQGIIATTSDQDYFKFSTSGSTTITVNVDEYVNNLDVQFTLYAPDGVTPIVTINPSNSFDATLTQSLPAGSYYLKVTSHGSTGEVGQYSLRIDGTLPNTPPTITSNGGDTPTLIDVLDDTTTVTTVTATDPDPGDTLTYSITGGADSSLFSIDPVSGALVFNSPADYEHTFDSNADGFFEVTVQVSDGTDIDTQNLTIRIIDVSEAPLTHDNTVISSEDKLYIFSRSDFPFSDNDVPAGTFLAVIVNPATTGSLLYDGVLVTTPTTIPIGDIDVGKLIFNPDPDGWGTAYSSFNFQVKDSGNSANGGKFLSDLHTMTLDVTPVADTLTVANTSTHENTLTPVGVIITLNPNDGAEVPYVKITDINNGTLYLSDGTTPVHKNDFITTAQAHAGLKFLPDPNFVSPSSIFTFDVQGATSANDSDLGGDVVTAVITVTPLYAPVLNPAGNPSLTSIPEDTFNSSGTSIKDLIASTALGSNYITDPNSDDPKGIALYSAPSSGGNWQYTLNNGGLWTTISGVSQTNALLLAADDAGNTRLRFVPLTNFNGTRQVYFRAWDQTSGINGGFANITTNGGKTPFSLKADSATITVTPVNDAPLLFNTYNPVVPSVNKAAVNNPGFKVSNMIASVSPNEYITDVDGGPEGIAIYQVQDIGGHWEYSLDNGGAWASIGVVSATNALLLKSDASTYLRFVPNNTTIGDRKIFFRAWDQSSGTAGTKVDTSTTGTTTPFSVGADSVALTVKNVNDAPVLNAAGSPTLPTISKTNSNPAGISILDLIASGGTNYITDLESTDPKGIAIYGAPNSGGTWEYSLDSGAHWTGVGTVDQSNSLLLKAVASTMIRFRPNGVFTGSRVLSFSAWDQSTGTEGSKVDTNYDGTTTFNRGGTTAFSIARDTASITIT